MTKVSYLVKKTGLKGSIKIPYNYQHALEKAKQIGGYVVTVYSEVPAAPLNLKDLELREKRMEHFGLA